MLVNLIKITYCTFPYCYTDLGASSSTKEATGSFFREHFQQNHENTICVNFQFHNPRLSQKKCVMLCVCSTRLYKGCSTKEAIVRFLENTRCFKFQFHIAKLIQQKCIIQVSTTQDYVQLMQLMAFLVEHLKESHENSISVTFKSHVIKFDQKQYFRLNFCYTGLYAGWSVKETIGNFFCKALYRKS